MRAASIQVLLSHRTFMILTVVLRAQCSRYKPGLQQEEV